MQIYDKLLGLPLFQGLSSSDLQDIVAQVKFGFMRYGRNQVFVTEQQPCRSLLFVLDGDVEMLSTSADHSYTVAERLPTPSIIEPERIFGLKQHYTRRYTALSQCHLISVGKDDIMLLSSQYVVFRMNMMNILSTLSQRYQRILWQHHPESVEERIRFFIRRHCVLPSGRKVIRIKMQELADEINDSRLDVSTALNKMSEDGVIQLQRGIITVPRLEML